MGIVLNSARSRSELEKGRRKSVSCMVSIFVCSDVTGTCRRIESIIFWSREVKLRSDLNLMSLPTPPRCAT